MDGRRIYLSIYAYVLILLLLSDPSLQCGPGRVSTRLTRRRKQTPLVFKQHVPSVSENTLGASGPSEGKISKSDDRFKDLASNHNPDIIFKNEEGTGADRVMSRRCKDKLNTLAITVMNQWPGVKLRVTEAWDEGGHHAADSLHYEGRAVDITTSDRDRSKYGMLARLAVEAGYDWVYYESRGHIHCSVASDSSAVVQIGGCFPGSGKIFVQTEGWKRLSDLNIGERVLTMNSKGQLEFSEVLTFLDKDVSARGLFHALHLINGATVTLTSKHLIYVQSWNSSIYYEEASFRAIFAEDVREGDYVYVVDNRTQPSGRPKLSRVIQISRESHRGVFAPLTSTGTIVVEGVVTSCYAFINDVSLAHMAFAPVRLYHGISGYMPATFWTSYTNNTSNTKSGDGVHWYARMLYSFGQVFLSKDVLYAP